MGPTCIAVDGGSAAAAGYCNGCLGWEGEDGEGRGGVAELCWRGVIGDLFCAFLEGFGISKEGEDGKAEGGLSGGGDGRGLFLIKTAWWMTDGVCCFMVNMETVQAILRILNLVYCFLAH